MGDDLREQIAREIEAHAEYCERFTPVPEFLVGLSAAAEVVRVGGGCPVTASVAVPDELTTLRERIRALADEWEAAARDWTDQADGMSGDRAVKKYALASNYAVHSERVRALLGDV